jgi:hypothetical protein
MNGNGKGFRQKPQENRKERLNTLEKRLAQIEMASRISQMMTQQMMNNMRNMQQDLGRALGLLSEMQYKILAIQEVSGLDLVQMNEVANAKRLVDFNEASDREDADGQFTVGDVVEADSTIILTSTTKNVDQGIFRSRIKLADCGVPDLIKAFTGAQVGAKANVSLNGVDHEIELLGIRQPPPAQSASDEVSGVSNDGSGREQVLAAATTSAQDGNIQVVQ